MVPDIRRHDLNDAPVQAERDFVLYWMTAFRRTRHNFALQRAVEWCRELDKPLVVLEALRAGYEWSSDRIHRFVIDGMAANRDGLAGKPVLYYPYVETRPDDGRGLLRTLAGSACVVVADDWPAFFLPRMRQAAARQVDCRMEEIDANGLLPLRATDKVWKRAHDFRRFLQRELPRHLDHFPEADPIGRKGLPRLKSLPDEVERRWPRASDDLLDETRPDLLAGFEIDHSVPVVDGLPGGHVAAAARMREFLDHRLADFAEGRNHVEASAASGFSPYLHFGHLSTHEVFARLAADEDWNPSQLADKPTGKREGWWGMSPGAESFLDEIATWREIGHNMAHLDPDYETYDSLPDWARKTLADHADDEREHLYDLEQFETAATHDELWNACQNELRVTGSLHNYLRMLWGKKILHWSDSPRTAAAIMVHLNNKYGIDGRDPNSYSGIYWCLGRYDRAWGPERPIFGKVRYMTCRNTRRKYDVGSYVARYADVDWPS